MANYVTSLNPEPVKLKFEKVYLPCILQTKKRYCGNMFENEGDDGVLESKGEQSVGFLLDNSYVPTQITS